MRQGFGSIVLVMAWLIAASPALAWHDEGHVYAARAAVEALPDDVPAFFREGVDTIAHGALDPDVIRNRALPQLRDADAPEHFIDYEYLQGRDLPPTRYAYIDLCEELGVDPGKVGTLPYAVVEGAQWLTVAFAEHRRWPDNEHVRMKCLVLAGILSHYTADLQMPLHTTVHYDGLIPTDPDDPSGTRFLLSEPRPFRGLHAQVDALPTKLPYAELFAEPLDAPRPRADLFAYVVEELKASHALVGRAYELAPRIPAAAEMSIEDEEVRAFTIDRMRAAAAFTSNILLSAWRNSAELSLPNWLDRSVFDEDFDPKKVPPQPAP